MRALGVMAAAVLLTAAGSAQFSLADISVGESVLDVVKAFGPPDKVATSDAGHEWRWYDAKGIDRDVLTDDGLAIHEILAQRPLPDNGKPAPLVQPKDAPFFEAPVDAAAAALKGQGAVELRESNAAAKAWRWRGAVLAADVRNGMLMRLRGLDTAAAQRLGYLPQTAATIAYRAPKFEHVASVGYPRNAIDAGEHGVVVVRVDVNAKGGVSTVTVVLSSGSRDLDNAEISSMRASSFTPASCNGTPCAGVLFDRAEFVL